MTATEQETYSRGRESFERGNIEEALTAFETLLESRSGFADVHYMVGILLERKGDLEAATDSLRQAIRINPSYAEALLALATVHEHRGDYERSRELAERASMVSRGTPGALDATTRGKLANLQAAVADAYADVGELREAIEGYRKALDRCPDYHDIRCRLGVALRESGLPSQAEREFRRVLRSNPVFLDAQVQLGLTYYTMGRSHDAIAQWTEVLQQDPGRDDARMYMRLLKSEAPSSSDSG
jgi:tetratricopeptide (TPR) repeat protein